MELRPDDQGAMFYMSLAYLEKAAVECDDLTAREEDQKTARVPVRESSGGPENPTMSPKLTKFTRQLFPLIRCR